MGLGLKGLDQPSDAALSYRKAVALKPDYPEALSNLGNILLDRGDPGDAIDERDRRDILEVQDGQLVRERSMPLALLLRTGFFEALSELPLNNLADILETRALFRCIGHGCCHVRVG